MSKGLRELNKQFKVLMEQLSLERETSTSFYFDNGWSLVSVSKKYFRHGGRKYYDFTLAISWLWSGKDWLSLDYESNNVSEIADNQIEDENFREKAINKLSEEIGRLKNLSSKHTQCYLEMKGSELRSNMHKLLYRYILFRLNDDKEYEIIYDHIMQIAWGPGEDFPKFRKNLKQLHSIDSLETFREVIASKIWTTRELLKLPEVSNDEIVKMLK